MVIIDALCTDVLREQLRTALEEPDYHTRMRRLSEFAGAMTVHLDIDVYEAVGRRQAAQNETPRPVLAGTVPERSLLQEGKVHA